MRGVRTIAVVIFLRAAAASAQGPVAEAPAWSGSATVNTYLLPGEGNYAQPTFAAEHGPIHVEARYNYEALGAGSFWAGYTFDGGTSVAWSITPMMGRVFGSMQGFGPGLSASLAWRKIDLSSEGQYIVDVLESTDSFFYNWSELTVLPVEWLRIGLVTQRTRVWASNRDLQRGPLVGVSIGRVDLTAYALNPDDSAPTIIMSLGINFGSN